MHKGREEDIKVEISVRIADIMRVSSFERCPDWFGLAAYQKRHATVMTAESRINMHET